MGFITVTIHSDDTSKALALKAIVCVDAIQCVIDKGKHSMLHFKDDESFIAIHERPEEVLKLIMTSSGS